MPRYELVEGTSSKFWDVAVDGPTLTVRFGRIGTAGQVQTKALASPEAAQAEHDKLVREKLKKGYSLVGEGAGPAATPVVTPAPVATPAAAPPPPPPPPPPGATRGGRPAGAYALSVADGRIVARNLKGKVLASVPKELKEAEPYLALVDALAALQAHAEECRAQVEGWMLKSLPVPADVIAAVWPDEAWRGLLENAVVAGSETGLLRGVGPRGVGVVTLDGDTRWLGDTTVTLPHPILLGELDDWRGLLAETGLTQGLAQLFRETFPRPADGADATTVDQWEGGEFDLLAQAMGEAQKAGYRVRGGAACCTILEGGRVIEARYDLGEGDPLSETTTGSLYWVDPDGQTLARRDVGPVAWSEGMRMAATIYKKRKVEAQEDDG